MFNNIHPFHLSFSYLWYLSSRSLCRCGFSETNLKCPRHGRSDRARPTQWGPPRGETWHTSQSGCDQPVHYKGKITHSHNGTVKVGQHASYTTFWQFENHIPYNLILIRLISSSKFGWLGAIYLTQFRDCQFHTRIVWSSDELRIHGYSYIKHKPKTK